MSGESVMLVRFVQLENAPVPIEVTESGISKLDSEVQPLNAESPIWVTESGISILESEVQP